VCGAGRGPLRSGDDGVTNLGGACFKAGAVCVLISPIDLEQTATEKLLDLFHERFAAGETPARAMLAARRALAADPRFADPFYHSMLQVVGIGHRPLVR
jgi:CHAT domain-containing protein